MKQLTLKQTTPLLNEKDGTIRVRGSRVTLDTIVSAFQKGSTAEQIQDSFPSLSLRQIYGAIAYYLERKDEVNSYLKRRQAAAQALRREIESEPENTRFRERIRDRRDKLIKS